MCHHPTMCGKRWLICTWFVLLQNCVHLVLVSSSLSLFLLPMTNTNITKISRNNRINYICDFSVCPKEKNFKPEVVGCTSITAHNTFGTEAHGQNKKIKLFAKISFGNGCKVWGSNQIYYTSKIDYRYLTWNWRWRPIILSVIINW